MNNLNSCIAWDTDHPSLEVVKNWENEQLFDLENRIKEKEQHIEMLLSQKERYMSKDVLTTDLENLKKNKIAELESVNSSTMKRFSKGKIDELEKEIEEIDSKIALARRRSSESTAMVEEFESNIKADRKSIKNLKLVYEQSAEAFEETKNVTRLFSGIPFSAINLGDVVFWMLDKLTAEKEIQCVEIQSKNNVITMMLSNDDNYNPVLEVYLNTDLLYAGNPTGEDLEDAMNAFYSLFQDKECLVYDNTEKQSQAMEGQYVNAPQMMAIFEAVGKIQHLVNSLNHGIEHFNGVMNLPDESSEIVDRKELADTMDNLMQVKEQAADPRVNLVPETESEVQERKSAKTESYVSAAPIQESQAMMQNPAPAQPQPIMQNQTVQAAKNQAQPAQALPKVEVPARKRPKPKGKRNTAKPAQNVNASANPQPVVQARPVSQTVQQPQPIQKPQTSKDMSYAEFDAKFRAQKNADLAKSMRTVREANRFGHQ